MSKKKLLSVALFSLIILTASFALYQTPNEARPLLIFPKGSSYEKEWAKVDSLTNKGLSRSALEVVNGIYKKAKSENNAPQIVKAMIHKMKFESYIEEDSYVKAIYDLQKEADGSFYPVKPVLHSITAEVYWRYYQNNRWKFQNRTETIDIKLEDIRTWGIKKLLHHVIRNHQLSLRSEDSLKRTPISTFDDVLIVYDNSRKYRPTLYDFLAHRAVDFYMSEEPDITRPAYKFEIEGTQHFNDATDFVRLELTTKDSMSLKFYAIQTLQDLLSFHLMDDDPRALVDADLKRLKFVRTKSIHELKDSLYLASLERLEKRYTTNPVSAEVSYEIANYYNNRGGKYKPLESNKHKWDKKKALEICDATIEKFPGFFGSSNCKSLRTNILNPSLKFDIERVYVPAKPFKMLLESKNLKKVWFRVAVANHKEYLKMKRKKYDTEWIDYVRKLKPVKEWTTELKDDGDLQIHNMELKVPELQHGYYVLLAGSDQEFSYSENGIAYSPFWVSNISFLTRQMQDGSYDVHVFNRETGHPIQGVSAQLYTKKYNYTLRQYEDRKLSKHITDADGYFRVSKTDDYRSFYMDLTKGEDRLNTDNSYYQYRQYRQPRARTRTFFFTDRGIYRPGQTIYFKGIVIETDGDKNSIKSGFATTALLYDVNHQKVSELKLTTNEYGTVSGTFTAPTSSLNGQMYISNSYGTVYFYVEEYKRPKFEVTFQPVKGTFKLGEKVKVTGLAKAYAGSNIDDAQVQFRVIRNASFPSWWYWRGYYPSSAQMEISNGVSKTDEKGEFEIEFTAIPDKSVSKKYKPTYTYTVYADVTDITGETHSSQQYVRVGYNALEINVNVPDQLEKNGEDKYTITTANLMGEKEPAKGRVVVHALKKPSKVFRKRAWGRPDRFSMTKEEYYSTFPKDVYDNESNMYKWEKGAKVYDRPFDTEKSTDLTLLKLPEWTSGYFKLEATCIDKFGEEVKFEKYLKVFSKLETSMAFPVVRWFVPIKVQAEPGEDAEFLVGSAGKNVKMIYEIEHKGKIVEKKWLNLNGKQQLLKIPVEEKHRGNLAIHFAFIKDNRSYTYDQVITVPYSNKRLDIEFATFRNKLYPGQEEEWKVKIKGPKGEKVAAEMLVAMYDASLDAFRPNSWNFSIFNSYYSGYYWQKGYAFGTTSSTLFHQSWINYRGGSNRYYDYLNWFGFNHYFYGRYGGYDYSPMKARSANGDAEYLEDAMEESSGEREKSEGNMRTESKKDKAKNGESTVSQTPDLDGHTTVKQPVGGAESDDRGLEKVKARTNFNETAFFFPQLETNEDGEVVIKFTIPEALTRWKFMGMAHTKDLKSGTLFEEIVTQKELMVMPNAPRFFREGDKMTFTAKVSNLAEKDLEGQAELKLFDALSMKEITHKLVAAMHGKFPTIGYREFKVKKGQSTPLSWDISIPEGYGAITYRVVAKAGKFSDGEEAPVPVLTNRMLVTESMPLPIRGMQTKTFTFDKLINSGSSTTLKHHKLTLEFTSQPAWYAIQALPYMMEYPYECTEQTFSRFYANSIASHIANSSPKIKRVFDSWKTQSPDALLSNLEKNQELKSLMLEETPWVLDAKNESERKKRVGLLFDLNRMSNELGRALKKLEQAQTPNGGWTWFPGMPDSRYITQHIVCGFGHLDRLGIRDVRENRRVWHMVAKAVPYLDNRIREDYEFLLRHKIDLDKKNIGYTQIHYLYARSYFTDIKVSSRNKKAFDYYLGQAKKYWLENSRYMQGMIALALHRYEVKTVPMDIMKSLKENAMFNEELGMYWKENVGGWYWYQAPIETQALLIEAFDEVAQDEKAVDDMKVWLLKQKQTQDWKTTKATAEACYALLLRGDNWLESDELVQVSLGNMKIDPRQLDDVKVEAGTGYYKTSWSKTEIKPEWGNVTVTKNDKGVAWGALYWQYFEQLDKITPHETPLKLNKKIFLEKRTDSGPVITPVTSKTKLKPGDKLKIRIELRVDRAMEFVHMKDMRASGFEPMNVISRYKWQDGLGYYESTRDAATNFFFDYLPKGTYVFEYPLRVTHEGDFSNGITTIQCMYAPEFTSHSEGVRVKVGSY